MAFRLFLKKVKKNPQKRLTNPGGLVKVVKRGEERQRTSVAPEPRQLKSLKANRNLVSSRESEVSKAYT
jgi:predicted ATPase